MDDAIIIDSDSEAEKRELTANEQQQRISRATTTQDNSNDGDGDDDDDDVVVVVDEDALLRRMPSATSTSSASSAAAARRPGELQLLQFVETLSSASDSFEVQMITNRHVSTTANSETATALCGSRVDGTDVCYYIRRDVMRITCESIRANLRESISDPISFMPQCSSKMVTSKLSSSRLSDPIHLPERDEAKN